MSNTTAEKCFRGMYLADTDLGLSIALYAFANHLLQGSYKSRYSAHFIWTAIYAYRRALTMDGAPYDIRLGCIRGLVRTASEPVNSTLR